MRFPDDAWREILDANGFFPSGATEEVWRSPSGGIKVKIDVNRETDEPYYEVVTENGNPTQGTDAEELKSLIVPKEPEPLAFAPPASPTSPSRLNVPSLRSIFWPLKIMMPSSPTSTVPGLIMLVADAMNPPELPKIFKKLIPKIVPKVLVAQEMVPEL